MSAIERQTRRLEILGALCCLADFSINKILYRQEILESFPKLSSDVINSEMLYLHKKGFIESTTTHSIGGCGSVDYLKLTTYGIDLIEKMETGQDTSEFEQHFSKPSIDIYIVNNSNSPIVIGPQNIYIATKNKESKELLDFFDKIAHADIDNKALQSLVKEAHTEISKGTASKAYLKAIVNTMLNIGASITGNFLTPMIVNYLGIPIKQPTESIL